MIFGGKKRKLKGISSSEISSGRLSFETLESRVLLSTLVFDEDPSSAVKRSTAFELDDSGLTVIESEIDYRNDKDCYVFTADRSGLLSISMEAADSGRGSSLDSMLFAYDSTGKKIASNDDVYYRDTNSQVEFYVESGLNYYVKADGYKDSIGSYRITIESPEEGEPLWEDSDYSNKIKTAYNIDELSDEYGNVSIEAGIYPAKDKDYFTFTVPETASYSITVSAEGSPLDSIVSVYDVNRKQIAKNDDIDSSNSDSSVEISAEQGDVIYIKTNGWKRSLGTYVLTIDNLDVVSEDESTVDTGDTGSESDSGVSSDDSSGSNIQGVFDEDSDATGWLLSITISDYNGSINDLDGPIVDAQLISEVFTDYYSVPQENVYQITSEETVDYDAMDRGFEWLAENAGPNDYVFVYYSGHGYAGRSTYVNDNEGLLLPDNYVVYQDDLENWLNQIDTDANKVVMIDSCFAGGLAELADNVSNTLYIGSAGHDQYAWDEVRAYYPSVEYRGGGIFANWIEYGILSGNADSNDNGFVSLLEAYNYADLNINFETGTGRNNQDPVINSSISVDSILLLG